MMHPLTKCITHFLAFVLQYESIALFPAYYYLGSFAAFLQQLHRQIKWSLVIDGTFLLSDTDDVHVMTDKKYTGDNKSED